MMKNGDEHILLLIHLQKKLIKRRQFESERFQYLILHRLISFGKYIINKIGRFGIHCLLDKINRH